MFLVGGKTLCWSIAQATEVANGIFEKFGIVVSIEKVEEI